MTMVCNSCGAEFAVGLSLCPQCTSESAHEKGEEMPKATVNGGDSYDGEEVTGQWDGSKPSTSSEKDETTGSDSSPSDQSPAPTTESHFSQDPEESSSAPSTDGAGAGDPYDSWTKDDLVAELADRDLPVSGNKPDLIARLREDDQKE